MKTSTEQGIRRQRQASTRSGRTKHAARFALIGAVALVVLGCTSAGEPRGGTAEVHTTAKPTLHCTPSSDCIVVVQKKCVLGFIACKTDVSHDPVVVTGGANTIRWVLAGPDLHWRAGGGIAPEAGSGIRCNPPAGSNTVHCENTHQPKPAPGWKYTVMLEGLPDLDPFIVNN